MGFLPNQHMKDNVRILLNILELADKCPSKKLGLIFIDAKKAFDKLEWEFLKCMIEEIEIGTHFWMQLERYIKNKCPT